MATPPARQLNRRVDRLIPEREVGSGFGGGGSVCRLVVHRAAQHECEEVCAHESAGMSPDALSSQQQRLLAVVRRNILLRMQMQGRWTS